MLLEPQELHFFHNGTTACCSDESLDSLVIVNDYQHHRSKMLDCHNRPLSPCVEIQESTHITESCSITSAVVNLKGACFFVAHYARFVENTAIVGEQKAKYEFLRRMFVITVPPA